MLAVLFIFYVLSFMDRYALTMLVEPIQADLGLTDFQMGIVLGPAFGVVFVLLGMPLGWMADRFPRRWVVGAGVAAWSLFTAASGLATTMLALTLARMGVGAGEACLSPAATSLLADRFPRKRLTLALAIYNSGVKVGSAAAFGIGGALIGMTAGKTFLVPLVGELKAWQLAFLLIGAPGLLFSLLAFTFAEPVRRGRAFDRPANATALLGFLKTNWRLMAPMLLGFSLMALTSYCLSAWTPTFLSRRFHWSPAHYGPALGVINLLAAATLVLKGGLVDWLYGRGVKDAHLRFYGWLLAATTPIALCAFLLPNPWVFLALYGVLQVVAVPSMVYLSATLPLIAPNEMRGQLAALGYTLYVLLGLGLGPASVGAITDYVLHDKAKVGWSLTMVIGMAFPAAFLLLRSALRPLHKAIEAAEALER